MRSRRQFRPMFDYLPGRIAPSSTGIVADPTNPSSVPTQPISIIDPTNPTANPTPDPAPSLPTTGPGSYTTPSDGSGTLLC